MSPNFLSYGFGWFIEDFRGRRWVNHGGNIDGMAAMVGFLPEDRIGVVILTNMNQSDVTLPLTANLFDRVLGIWPPKDYNSEYYVAAKEHEAKRRAAAGERPHVVGTKPSLPLSAYAGVYRNSYLGTASVRLEPSGALSIQYDASPAMAGDLEHWHYDSFMATMRDPMLGKIPVTFRLGGNGQVASMIFPIAPSEWIKQ